MTANLLTECDNCEVKYETNVWGTDSESIVEENGGQYFYCTDHTSKINKLFIVNHKQKILKFMCIYAFEFVVVLRISDSISKYSLLCTYVFN